MLLFALHYPTGGTTIAIYLGGGSQVGSKSFMSNAHLNPNDCQLTLKREVKVDGIGLHSGKAASVTLAPALPNTGILFVARDPISKTETLIPATFEFVTQTRLATTLGRKTKAGNVSLSTVEHLLSALKLMGVDNATVTVEGPELPIMDGSAREFCAAIASVGLQIQNAPKQVAVVKKRIEVRKGDKIASISPGSSLKIRARIEWNHPAIKTQELSYELGRDDPSEIAGARTFGFLKDVEALQRMGLARGGSLENAIVLDEHQVTNPDGLRYPDEFVRHKVLDAIGDFALSPIALMGHVTLVKAGHELHAELVQAVFSSTENYEVRNLSDLRKESQTPDTAIHPWIALKSIERAF